MLRISENRRHLTTASGEPFFWLADTAWELFHALNREDTLLYLDDRAEKSFNVIQAVLLAEFEGLRQPNAFGRRPLKKNAAGAYDPLLPDLDGEYSYWDHVDFVLDEAQKRGLILALLPTWGDKYNMAWGRGPEIFNGDNARKYGAWLGERYRDRENVVWVLGGDREYRELRHFEVVTGMAAGIRESGAKQLITAHPMGGRSSSLQLKNEPWMDFHMIQSGHGERVSQTAALVEKDYAAISTPVIDAEANYEDHPVGFTPANGYFDAADVRKASYWAVFAGSAGITYGHQCIWGFYRFDASYIQDIFPNENGYLLMSWKDALGRPGAGQMRHLKGLMESCGFGSLEPDQGMIARQYEGANHVRAMRGARVALFYVPSGVPLHVRLGAIEGARVEAVWFDPRTGEERLSGELENGGEARLFPPSAGRENDWVLVLRSK